MKVFIVIGVLIIIFLLLVIYGAVLVLQRKQDDTNKYLVYFEGERIKEKQGDSEQPHISIN